MGDPIVLKDATLFLQGHDMSRNTNAVALEHSADLKNITCFGDLAVRRTAGFTTSNLSIETFANVETGNNIHNNFYIFLLNSVGQSRHLAISSGDGTPNSEVLTLDKVRRFVRLCCNRQ